MKALFTLCALWLLTATVQAALPDWQAPRGLDDPHLGQVLDTATGEWLAPGQLVERLLEAPYVLVGEKHDNPDHHALQLWLLEQLQARRPQGALVMEMLGPQQQAAVDEQQGRMLPEDAALVQALDWNPGWDWQHYGPLVRWGLAVPQRLLAANLGRDEMSALYRQPQPLSEVYRGETRETLAQIMRESHCHKLPETQVPAMLAIQQGRDQRMAEVLQAAPTPALLLAGGYHVRKDLGVPLHWAGATAPRVLMLVEAGSALPDEAQADYVWLTPATEEQDYCAGIS